MKSTTGKHYVALDHVRALAAFMVFTWHFGAAKYGGGGGYAPDVFPLSLLSEGHTGVALFMVLSGYLFAKLLEGKRVRYADFLRNRMLRLLPLLVLAVTLVGVRFVLEGRTTVPGYLWRVAQGVVLPTLPYGAWSITVEFHFYLLLPFLLWCFRRSPWAALSVLAAALALRLALYEVNGEVQRAAYWTLIGRIDQFVLGIAFFHLRGCVARRHLTAACVFLVFAAFYWYFDRSGGFYHNPRYPSPSPLWIVMPTIEGLAYGVLVAWYDASFTPRNSGVSGFVGRIGTWSYSIYLLHLFYVRDAARFIHTHVAAIPDFYVACLWSLLAFLAFLPVAWLSYRFVEQPFLRRRRTYVIQGEPT